MRFDRSKSFTPLSMRFFSNDSSVIALSKIYALNDQRVIQIMVKGDLIIPASNRIMTRSKAKQSKCTSPPI